MLDKLEILGFGDWFRRRVDAQKITRHDAARVVSVHKDSYQVSRGEGGVFAELSGNLFHTANSPADLPTTGDWVYADFFDDDTHAVIHGLMPRKTLLKRKTAGKTIDYQLIAANIDVAFIVQSVDFNLNLRRLERYLVMVYESDITPLILLSKCDLVSRDEIEKMKQNISAVAPQTRVLTFSNLNAESLESLKNAILPGHTYCLLGSSGVGKTTLLNSILGIEKFATQIVSKKQSKGRHTTTSRQLIQLENGGLLIDTPGMRELGNISVDAGLDETFSEIVGLARYCKFANCSHSSEQGCAILSAIEQGELSAQRYKNYLKMKNESAFNDMSLFEKRKKDKEFGKHIKATLKSKHKR